MLHGRGHSLPMFLSGVLIAWNIALCCVILRVILRKITCTFRCIMLCSVCLCFCVSGVCGAKV